MKKVIIVFDGMHFSAGAFDFLCRLNETGRILATGIFLPTIDYSELLYSIGGLSGPIYYREVINEVAAVKRNIEHFKTLCVRHNIEHRVHADMDHHVLEQLAIETRYADLMIIGGEYFYENLGEDTQDEYITETLHKAECPVLIVPEKYSYPDNVVLACDGSASSVFAIKQFTYILPAFTHLKTTLVQAGDHSDDDNAVNIEELAARHFDDLTIHRLDIHNPRKYFNTWLQDSGKPILVAGAYGRSLFSQTLKKSFIRETIKDHVVPVFIAHK